jgi:hypothetical protein
MTPLVTHTRSAGSTAAATLSRTMVPLPFPVRRGRPLPAARRAALVALLSGARRALVTTLVLGLALVWSIPAVAQVTGPASPGQPSDASSWVGSPDGLVEIRPFAGAFIPTGPQRTVLKNAVLAGAQVSARVIPALAVTGTFGWTPNNDRLTTGAPTLDVYQYDLGIEARGAGWFQGDGWDFTPFAGLGGGGRTYNYRKVNFSSTTDVDGYGSVGAELGYGRIGLRVEGRDYISQFKPLRGLGGTTTNRNDVALSAGLRIRL